MTVAAAAIAVTAAAGVNAAAAEEFPTVKISLACAPCANFVPLRPTRHMRNIRTAGHTVPTGPRWRRRRLQIVNSRRCRC